METSRSAPPLGKLVASAIADSIRAVFAQKGLAISDDLIRELANNSAQSVVCVLNEQSEDA